MVEVDLLSMCIYYISYHFIEKANTYLKSTCMFIKMYMVSVKVNGFDTSFLRKKYIYQTLFININNN